MSVNTELQALLKKMGGTPLDSDSNSDLIKKISNAYEGGGSSSSGALIVNLDVDRLDKTWLEIYNSNFAIVRLEYANEGFELAMISKVHYNPDTPIYSVMVNGLSLFTDTPNGYPETQNDILD